MMATRAWRVTETSFNKSRSQPITVLKKCKGFLLKKLGEIFQCKCLPEKPRAAISVT